LCSNCALEFATIRPSIDDEQSIFPSIARLATRHTMADDQRLHDALCRAFAVVLAPPAPPGCVVLDRVRQA
jgi:hypothetical protein